MEDLSFNIEVNATALKLLSKAVDKYLELWPGGDPLEQTSLFEIQLGLKKAVLECHLIESDLQ